MDIRRDYGEKNLRKDWGRERKWRVWLRSNRLWPLSFLRLLAKGSAGNSGFCNELSMGKGGKLGKAQDYYFSGYDICISQFTDLFINRWYGKI